MVVVLCRFNQSDLFKQHMVNFQEARARTSEEHVAVLPVLSKMYYTMHKVLHSNVHLIVKICIVGNKISNCTDPRVSDCALFHKLALN